MIRSSLVRLAVAFLALLTAVVVLLTVLVRLGATGVVSLTTWLAAGRAGRKAPGAPAAPLPANVRRLADARRGRGTPSNARVSGGAERPAAARLTFALVGMGWPAPAVRAFVVGLGDRVEREPVEKLIGEGLRALAA